MTPFLFYTLSLHDALPISDGAESRTRRLAGIASTEWDYNHHAIVTSVRTEQPHAHTCWQRFTEDGDRKSTRLNSSHVRISYAVFCLKKKNVLTLNIDV